MGRFINADAFAATGQGLLGNNMFSYCNNSPISYSDYSGQMMVPAFNPEIGGFPSVEDDEYYQSCDDGGFGFTDTASLGDGTVTYGLLVGDASGPGFCADESNEWGFSLFEFDVSAISGDWTNGTTDVCLFDILNLSANCGVSNECTGFEFLASVWSPSFSHDFGLFSLSVSVNVFAVGAEYNISTDGFKFGFSSGVGFSVGLEF